ncbi:3',5'-cyclic-nucleotide phosphodiesterase [Desulfobacterota bacterium AH_259_B03_O07]|nr:3',5'-cyclic-nucleotide phosphodiesterase [Desulfobacterota bacterium AH_259_B03_O07]
MKISILGCNGSRGLGLKPTAFLVDKNVLIDAGTCSEALSIKKRVNIDHILITHAHFDHIADLPFLAHTAHDLRKVPLYVYGIKEAIDDISNHIFNWRIWPSFNEIPNAKKSKISFKPVKLLKRFKVGSLHITAIPVNHTVPTAGLLVDNGKSAFAFTSDTYETELFWKKIGNHNRLKALIIECSFPNRLEETAKITGHLTPELLDKEISKLRGKEIRIFVSHLKPIYRREIIKELNKLSKKLPLKILEDGMEIKI